MTLRNTSGKFSLPSFGRKASGQLNEPDSPSRHYGDDDYYSSHNRESSGGQGGSPFDGFGKKLGKSLAHTSLLPALGNKDLRALQDVINAEKGILTSTEKLAGETHKAALSLPAYGSQEGPDLADVMSHSSTLLSHLSTAFLVFTAHQQEMRGCYKRIREREEGLEELRRTRRHTGQKAENAERKLAKMGVENKGLPTQTDLLERLRVEMRQEALSLKFGGLEELGEKMCIIGELGKLLLEEIPLEETPPGYGRAPYTGYEKTENAANEATKCLATVKFVVPDIAPRPPGLPHPAPTGPLPQSLGHEDFAVVAAEEYAHYPGNVASPSAQGKDRGYSSHDGYGGLSHNPYAPRPVEDESGAQRGEVVFAEPPETSDPSHDYEWEQQKQMDVERAKEEAVWRENETEAGERIPSPVPDEAPPRKSWEPLNISREKAVSPAGDQLHHMGAPLAPPIDASNDLSVPHPTSAEDDLPLAPPPPISDFQSSSPRPDLGSRATSQNEGFYTPLEGPGFNFAERGVLGSSVVPTTGKISAGAFRKGAGGAPRTRGTSLSPDLDPEELSKRKIGSPPAHIDTDGAGLDHDENVSPPPGYAGDEDLR
ncbi:hypothetical protein P7C73_g485, partial [Tremellales sp. Uapishka_1]